MGTITTFDYQSRKRTKILNLKIPSILGRAGLIYSLYFQTMDNGNNKKDKYSLEEVFYRTLSEMLAEERNESDPSNQKVSQFKLSDHSEVSKNYVGMVERGELHPSLFILVKLLVNLDKDPAIFLSKFLKKVNVTKKGIELDSQRNKLIKK